MTPWLSLREEGCTTETHLHACLLFVPFLILMSCPETMSLTTRKLWGAQESKLVSWANCMSHNKICCLMTLDGSGHGCIHGVIYTFFCIMALLLKGKLRLRCILIEAGFSSSLPPVKSLLAWLYFPYSWIRSAYTCRQNKERVNLSSALPAFSMTICISVPRARCDFYIPTSNHQQVYLTHTCLFFFFFI